LVASAGGLDAVTRVLSRLPEDLPATVLVLIHQAPERVNQLVHILGRDCRLPVTAAEHDEPLPTGSVLIAPPGQHLLIAPGLRTLLVMSGDAPPSRPSADLLLATLATAAGSRAVAVVLSGGGHDGATGATAVHVCGGTVVATDEASSSSFSMPSATIQRDGAIDHVVALDGVAELLLSLVAPRAGQLRRDGAP
jgi:two-component system, chemotaxis family, protein-glutamate methylesterase/glutaminase